MIFGVTKEVKLESKSALKKPLVSLFAFPFGWACDRPATACQCGAAWPCYPGYPWSWPLTAWSAAVYDGPG